MNTFIGETITKCFESVGIWLVKGFFHGRKYNIFGTQHSPVHVGLYFLMQLNLHYLLCVEVGSYGTMPFCIWFIILSKTFSVLKHNIKRWTMKRWWIVWGVYEMMDMVANECGPGFFYTLYLLFKTTIYLWFFALD